MREFEDKPLRDIPRKVLQNLLDRKTGAGFSFSVVDHLRWDLKQIFDMALAEGIVQRNPAMILFTPKDARRPERRIMNCEEVQKCFAVLELRERLIAKLAILAGMRPGEIFGLKWEHVNSDSIQIKQRLYRGTIDTPKTHFSVRSAAISSGLVHEIEEWRSVSPDPAPQSWIFPSENLRTPLAKDNCWRRHMLPRLTQVGLEWVNFQVMRRTHASLLHALTGDPKLVADQLGHSVDVNQNVYTQSGVARRKEMVERLELELISRFGVQTEYKENGVSTTD